MVETKRTLIFECPTYLTLNILWWPFRLSQAAESILQRIQKLLVPATYDTNVP